MLGLSRSPGVGHVSSETDREDSPPPAPDVTADPRAPKCSLPSPCSTTVASDRSSAFGGPPLSGYRNNEVRSVLLYGVPIVALVIEGYERLCLAQISNTLLKTFSYNEIHNRRVALGITCVQCTPVQLELLRRAGAMPVSSRRCGLITKREAERLCKSFLADARPPKLPDNFAFEVAHACAWGCRGSFVPARYNSSRAKCIKCAFCALFFSPNKFIFHSHRLPDSKYVQPDAANFNSWRRHIRLAGAPPDQVVYAWEDVKAMFNGGSRKRIVSCSSSRGGDGSKRPRPNTGGPGSKPESTPYAPSASGKGAYFPVVPLPNKSFALPPAAGPFAPPGSAPFGALAGSKPLDIRQTFAEYMWAGKPSFPLPYGSVLWPRAPLEGRVEPTLPPYGLADTTTAALSDPGRPPSSASEAAERETPSPRLGQGASAFRPVGRRSQPRTADTTTHSRTCCSSPDEGEVDVTDVSSDAPADQPDTSGEAHSKEEKLEMADSPDSKNDELKEVLLQEAEARRRAEREYQAIRDTFEEQVRKEIAYREEVAKQLQIVREAHDALQHFSCKMLASRHCAECGYKPPLPE